MQRCKRRVGGGAVLGGTGFNPTARAVGFKRLLEAGTPLEAMGPGDLRKREDGGESKEDK